MSSELTAKQQKFASKAIWNELALLKLKALDQISGRLGMFDAVTDTMVLEKRWESLKEIVPLLFLRIMNPKTPNYSRCASTKLLDYIWPEWRAFFGNKIVGFAINRSSPEARRWRRQILERDGFKCTQCDRRDDLHAHHVLHWAKYPSERLVLANGVTLCESCHLESHNGSWSSSNG